MNKKIITIALTTALSISLVACSSPNNKKANEAAQNNTKTSTEVTNNKQKTVETPELKDGKYTGKSSEDDHGGHVEVTITVSGGEITDTEVKNFNKDGSEKDENYGKEAGEDGYKIAQKTLEASQEYGKSLTEKGEVSEVEAISGATSSYNQFVEAANDAISQAK